MCSTISQNAARSCRTPSGFVQRHGFAVSLAAPGRRGWPCAVALEAVFVAVHLFCDCPSEPPSASRAGQAVKSANSRASRRGFRGISSPGKKRPVPVFHDPETPPVTPACNRLNAQPWPPFLRRLRRAEHHRKGEQPWQQKPPAPQITTQGVPPAPPRPTKGQFFRTKPSKEITPWNS